jgi:2-keto-3-deoxy-L-rhamnonate aldolase RhmA
MGSPRRCLVRIAPIANGRDAAEQRAAEVLAAGADGVVFPRVRSREDAELAAELLRAAGRGVWPEDRDGRVVGYFMGRRKRAGDPVHARRWVRRTRTG